MFSKTYEDLISTLILGCTIEFNPVLYLLLVNVYFAPSHSRAIAY